MKMPILFVLADCPHMVTSGTRLQTISLLQYVSREAKCDVIAVCGDEAKGAESALRGMVPRLMKVRIIPRCSGIGLRIRQFKQLVAGGPVFLARWPASRMMPTLRAFLKSCDYDVVHFEGLALARLASLCRGRAATVMSTIDPVSLAYLRTSESRSSEIKSFYLRRAARAIAAHERKYLPLATKVHVVSEPDARYVRRVIDGVDVESVPTVVPKEVIEFRGGQDREGTRLLFTGQAGVEVMRRGLYWFLDEVYSRVRRQNPNVEMVVLGQTRSKRIQRRVEASPGVRYVGWAEDYYRELSRATVVVMPDQSGTGIKNRVLQAMALSRPVVGTPLAFEGVPVEEGVHCLACGTADEFAAACLRVLGDPKCAARMGEAARRLVLRHHTMESVGPQWMALYGRAVRKASALGQQSA